MLVLTILFYLIELDHLPFLSDYILPSTMSPSKFPIPLSNWPILVYTYSTHSISISFIFLPWNFPSRILCLPVPTCPCWSRPAMLVSHGAPFISLQWWILCPQSHSLSFMTHSFIRWSRSPIFLIKVAVKASISQLTNLKGFFHSIYFCYFYTWFLLRCLGLEF